jgi:prepilin-type N-terminal cleavage/methylation domain-containing protein
MKHAASQSGFTLLEMLVALTMAAAVVTPLFVITRGVSETSRSKQMEVEAMQRARTAMDLLVRDFGRAGLFTSPNTNVDSRFFNRETVGSTVQHRGAVSHLNRGTASAGGQGNDAVMLTGNFLGSDTYSAYATGQYQLQIIDAMATAEECTRQFDPAYAVAHISDSSGKDLEAKVAGINFNTGICTLTIANTDYHPHSYKTGDFVYVSANQTALYLVEGTDLVRYFVDPTNIGVPNGGSCAIDSSVTSVKTHDDLNITGTVVSKTRQVLSNYVVNFQVWFRPVTVTAWTVPHYHTSANVVAQASGNYADGFKLVESLHVVPLTAGGSYNPEDVSCKSLADGGIYIGPERVRSALIQISVRAEKSDGSMRWTEMDTDPVDRLTRQLLAPVPTDTEGIPVPSGEYPFAYQVRTVTTEVQMPNLAARSDLLQP